jgi:hypothetical protein
LAGKIKNKTLGNNFMLGNIFCLGNLFGLGKNKIKIYRIIKIIK